MRSNDLELVFPNLQNTPYEVTSPEDTRYNCIAWAAGNSQRSWWPAGAWGYYWPGDPDDDSLEGFIAVFRAAGYEVCQSRQLEPGFEKVAIYANNDGVSHMARQLQSGLWTSKCGDCEDIIHSLEGLENSIYGSVIVMMKRPLGGSP